jgi:hypothetical protein
MRFTPCIKAAEAGLSFEIRRMSAVRMKLAPRPAPHTAELGILLQPCAYHAAAPGQSSRKNL